MDAIFGLYARFEFGSEIGSDPYNFGIGIVVATTTMERTNPASEVTIDAAGPQHVTSVLAMSRRMNEEDGHPIDAAGEAAVRLLCLGDMAARCWIARTDSGDHAVGYIVLTLGFSIEHGGRDGFIDELYVVPEMRGQGIGKKLMRIAEDAARALGVMTLHLEVEKENKSAQALYRDGGWRDTQRILMSKKL